MGAALAALAAGSTIAGGISGLLNSERNYRLQVQNLDYQKALQQQIFEREDTAIQRRKRDLEAAGFNPYLAMNSNGANSGSVVSTQAPQSNADFGFISNSVGSAIDMIKSLEQIKQSRLYTTFLGLQNENQELKNIDLGNWLDTEWLWSDDSKVWRRYDYRNSYGQDIFKNVIGSSLGFKRRMYDWATMSNDQLTQQYANDILKVNRDFAVSDKLEQYIIDGIDQFLNFKRVSRPSGPRSR